MKTKVEVEWFGARSQEVGGDRIKRGSFRKVEAHFHWHNGKGKW